MWRHVIECMLEINPNTKKPVAVLLELRSKKTFIRRSGRPPSVRRGLLKSSGLKEKVFKVAIADIPESFTYTLGDNVILKDFKALTEYRAVPPTLDETRTKSKEAKTKSKEAKAKSKHSKSKKASRGASGGTNASSWNAFQKRLTSHFLPKLGALGEGWPKKASELPGGQGQIYRGYLPSFQYKYVTEY